MLFLIVIVNALMVGHMSSATCEWKAQVKTGWMARADTDDSVYIRLYGSGKETSLYRLNSPKDNFEIGSTDKFSFQSQCLIPEKIMLWIVGRDGWFVQEVELERKDTKAKYLFAFYCWLDDYGHKIVKVVPTMEEECMYTAKVWTRTPRASGTNDRVYMQMFNSKGRWSASNRLVHKDHEEFMSGPMDTYNFEYECVIPKKIKIALLRPNGWDVLKVELYKNDSHGVKSYLTSCFDDCLIDGHGSRYFSVIPAKEEATCTYTAKIWTGKLKSSGTNDPMDIQIFDSNGKWSGRYFMALKGQNNFRSGSMDTYHFDYKCVIPMKIKFTLNGDDAWSLQKAELYLYKKDNRVLKSYLIPCSNNCWIKDKGSMIISVIPDREEVTCTYTLKVWTGKLRSSSTSGPVDIQIFDSNGIWSARHILARKGHDGLRSGSVEEKNFDYKCVNPMKIKFTLKGYDDWDLSKAELYKNDRDGVKSYLYSCSDNCSIDGYGSMIISVIRMKTCTYTAKIWTQKLRSSGTNDPLDIQICDSNGIWSRRYRLDHQDHYDFRSGSMEEYHFDYKCVIPMKIKFTLKGDDDWDLSKAELYKYDRDMVKSYLFSCFDNCSIDGYGSMIISVV